MSKWQLTRNRTALVVIDLQERLLGVMAPKVVDQVIGNVRRLVQIARVLGIEILWTEQYPKGLGPTVPALQECLAGETPLEKTIFSCYAVEAFQRRLREGGIEQVVVTGTETHICVLQTVLDLVEAGFHVHVIADACISRHKENWKVGLSIMREAGAVISSTETVAFQLLGEAGTPEFKEISPLFRDSGAKG
ncbi:MAG: hydrolase [Deltaproteobacteria bacterium]|nr:MAG: hydrolase [Deltaproteobacteria bacterium]